MRGSKWASMQRVQRRMTGDTFGMKQMVKDLGKLKNVTKTVRCLKISLRPRL